MRHCAELVATISEYLDGEVSTGEIREIELHLEQCPHCRSIYITLKTTIEVCHRAPVAELPPDIHDWLHSLLREMWEDLT